MNSICTAIAVRKHVYLLNYLLCWNVFRWQDEESALLEQALAMSMDDARSGSGAIADSDMSDVTTDDQELAFG